MNADELKPRYYECGCGHYHSAEWNGDCRQDDARHTQAALDSRFTPYGWVEVSMSEVDA